MKRISTLLVFSLVAGFSSDFAPSTASAHEGHAHSTVEAPHGGIVKEGKQMNLELVAQGSDVMLYPLAKDGKTIPLKEVQLTGTAQPPKKPKAKIDFKPMDDHFHGKIDSKGSYRYELQLEAKTSGKTDKFTYQVEPQG